VAKHVVQDDCGDVVFNILTDTFAKHANRRMCIPMVGSDLHKAGGDSRLVGTSVENNRALGRP